MRIKTWCYVVTFQTTMSALAFEEFCNNHNIKGRLIPVPSIIHSGCGLCYKMNIDEYEKHHDVILKQEHDDVIKIEI